MAETSIGGRKGRALRFALIGLGVLAVLAVIAGAGFLAAFNANSLKPRIIAAVKQATGRQLTLNGPIGLRLSLQPAIEARDVAFANPPGFSRPQMATLERLDLRIALLPLLHRRVEVGRLVLVHPDIRLETDAQGHSNWQLHPEAGNPANPPPPPPASMPAAPEHRFALGELSIQDGTLEYRNGGTGRSTALAIRQLSAAGSIEKGTHVTADASYNGLPVTLTAAIGPLQGNKPAILDARLEAAGASLTAKGVIADPGAMSGARISVAAQIPHLQALSPLAQSDLPGLSAIALQASLTDLAGGLGKGAALRDFKLTSPAGDLTGEITALQGAPPTLTAELRSSRLDIDSLLAAMGKPMAPPGGQTAPPPPRPKSGPIFSQQPLGFTMLKRTNADLRLEIADLHTSGVDYRALHAHAVLHDGHLQLDPLAADLPGGHMDAKLSVDGSQAVPPVSLSARAPGLALAPLLAAFKMPGYATGNLEIDADLHGAGQSEHAIAASLGGTLGLAVPGGTIDSQLIGGTFGNVLDRVNGLDPLRHGGSGKLRCLAVRIDLHNGTGVFRAFELSSSLLTLAGSGSIDLGTETQDMRLLPQGRIAGTDIVVPLHVTGPIRAPRTSVDAVSTARSNVGSVAGAVIGYTTPLGLLGGMIGADKMLGLTSGDPCPAALAIARGPGTGGQGAAGSNPTVPAPADAPARHRPKAVHPRNMLRDLLP